MTSRTLLIRGALAAILAAGSPAASTAMAQSADHGPRLKHPVRANVYVPPSPDTATREGQRWVDAHPAPQDLLDARKTANVYVPPPGSYADQVSSLSAEQLAAAYGTAIPNWIPTPASTPVASGDHNTNRWRIAAFAEAALLAALALSSAAFLRRRTPRARM
jgi:hypothetical protein